MKIILPEIANGEDKQSDFINCIRNSYRHIRKWAKRTETNCFRIYDREIYHYPLAIDFYAGRYVVHYFSPRGEDVLPPDSLVDEIESALVNTFGANPLDIYWKSRYSRKKYQQYERADNTGQFFPCVEYGVQFRVNLTDYLDTGLFLDHREARRLVASMCKGCSLLNLFAYTCSFSVHASMQGASRTKSIDMSNTYTEWGRENFLLNGLSLKNNEIVRADCMTYLDEEIARKACYDRIVVDPPTISRSKKMQGMFDIQQDYVQLLKKALMLLAPKGVLFFSTNCRTFSFDSTLFPECAIEEISHKTLAFDFHDTKIHRAWFMRKTIDSED